MKKKPKFLPFAGVGYKRHTSGFEPAQSRPLSRSAHIMLNFVDYRDQIKNYSPDRSIEKFVGVQEFF